MHAINLFNKTYDENRLKDDFADEGYGDWLKQTEEDTGVKEDPLKPTIDFFENNLEIKKLQEQIRESRQKNINQLH